MFGFHTECNPIIVIGLFIEACARLNWYENVDTHTHTHTHLIMREREQEK